MSEFTSINVKKDIKTKLDLIREESGKSHNQIITELLTNYDGVTINDVITIRREMVAFTLKFWEIENSYSVTNVDVTYEELRKSKVGDVFIANEEPNIRVSYVNSFAEVIYIKGDDVVVIAKELYHHKEGSNDINTSLVHIRLF